VIVLAHVGPVPVEELLAAAVVAVGVGAAAIRAKARTKLTRSTEGRAARSRWRGPG
jgi:hypothetical protein